MKKTKSNKIIYLAVVLAIVLSLFSQCCFGAKTEKIAIIPFNMNASQDLSFLQKGIFDMLSSRLSDGDKVAVLTRDEIDKVLEQAEKSVSAKGELDGTKARIIGANLGVEYVLFGSLTVIGESVSLDAQMIDVAGDKPDVTFSDQAEKLGGVIPLVNHFARDVNEKIFNRDVGREREQRQQQYSGQYPSANQDGYYDRNSQMPGQAAQGYYASPFGRFRNLVAIKGEINGIAVGDVNGDKKSEVVIIYNHIIEILEYDMQGKLRTIEQIEDSIGMDLIGVDVADINKNGYAEIFVTRSQSKGQKIASFVIEFDGSKYNTSKKRFPWYFKVVNNAEGKGKLYAQKHNSENGPYGSKQVFRVDWTDQTYVRGERLRVPKGFFILGMVVANNLSTPGDANHIFTDENGRLTIFNEAGAVQFSSEKYYGGSTLRYEFAGENKSRGLKTAYFQPGGNILIDIDDDGIEELVAIKNYESADYFFMNTRTFNSGDIEIMEWNELGVAPKLVPKKMPGQITSIQIGDYDNDSKMEMLVGFVKKKAGTFSSKSNSLLIAYELLKVKRPASE
ncbi:MAG: VCBS repeat-containing protein [Desulfobacteraceae bacterium]|nr:VCBS repeat-containing protein [Desulfobacteraceae bacterium]